MQICCIVRNYYCRELKTVLQFFVSWNIIQMELIMTRFKNINDFCVFLKHSKPQRSFLTGFINPIHLNGNK